MSVADKRLDFGLQLKRWQQLEAQAEAASESEVKNLNQSSKLRITLPMPFAICHSPFAICHSPLAVCHSPFGAGILMNCHTHASCVGTRKAKKEREKNEEVEPQSPELRQAEVLVYLSQ